MFHSNLKQNTINKGQMQATEKKLSRTIGGCKMTKRGWVWYIKTECTHNKNEKTWVN